MPTPYIIQVIGRLLVLFWDWLGAHYWQIMYGALILLMLSFVAYVVPKLHAKVISEDGTTQCYNIAGAVDCNF